MFDLTLALRAYAAFRAAQLQRQSPQRTQQRTLSRLLRKGRGTRFGRDHGFDRIASLEAFQRQVPIRRYEDFWQSYWRAPFPNLAGVTWPDHVPYFAVTSGTSTGKTKYIPVSRQMCRSNRRAGFDVMVHHLRNRPKSRVLGGKSFMLGGTVDLTAEGPAAESGDLTGIALKEAPDWTRHYTFAPASAAGETDWERKIEAAGRASLGEDIRTIAGTVSWLLLFFERLAAMAPGPKRLARLYPNLELIVHGGVSFRPYRERFESWLEGGHAELREVYPASEGFVATADRGSDEGLRMYLDGGIFYEFIPVEELDAEAPTRHWIGNVETGRDYALVMTTCAGLWAYLLGDTVRFVERDPPRLLVTGRVSYFLSAFGEHLTGEEIRDAVMAAAAALGEALSEFSVGAVHGDGEARGGHVFIVEFAAPRALTRARLERFAAVIDRDLAATNDDYATHRAAGFGMKAPEVRIVAPGTFAAWMKRRGKLGGQNKVPRVINDPELFTDLQDFTATRTVEPTE